MTIDIGGGVGLVTTIILAIQAAAAGLKNIPGVWGHGQTTGPGSGWYKFWNTIASFPGNPAAGVAAANQNAPLSNVQTPTQKTNQ